MVSVNSYKYSIWTINSSNLSCIAIL